MSEYMDDDMDEDYEPQYELVYEGEETVYNHLVKDGIAKAKFLNGDTFYGEYRGGKRHGHGIYTHLSGAVYDGEYADGQKDGQGRMTYPDGSMYDGQYLQGKRHGKGRYVYSNGDDYDGLWRTDKKHGAGVYHYSNGSVFTGVWGNGQVLHGSVAHTDGTTFSGTFQGTLPQGSGLYQFPSGLSESGQHVDGVWRKDGFRATPVHEVDPESIQKHASPLLHQALRLVGKSGIKADHFEHIHMLKRKKKATRGDDEAPIAQVPAAQGPNFRQAGDEMNVFVAAQPTVSGIKAIVGNVQELGYESACWFSLRDDPCVYVNDKPYHPRERKALNTYIPLSVELTSEERDEVEERFSTRILKDVRWRGGELIFQTENHSVNANERKNTEKSEFVPIPASILNNPNPSEDDDHDEEYDESKGVLSLRKAVEWVSQEEGVGIEFFRTPLSIRDRKKQSVDQIDAMLEKLSECDERTAVIVCSRTGRLRSTVGAAVALATQMPADEEDEENLEDEDDEEETEGKKHKSEQEPTEVKQDFLKAEYNVVLRLVNAMGEQGEAIKKRTDKVVDCACANIDNLRDSIFRGKTMSGVAVGDAQLLVWEESVTALSYYLELLLLVSYLKDFPVTDRETNENWVSYKQWRSSGAGKPLSSIVDDEEELVNFKWQ